MLIDVLRRRLPGTEIRTVNNGEEVMQWLKNCAGNELPSLIVLDYKMPGLTGAEVLKATERQQAYRLIPKVVWSTSSNAEYVAACMRHGAIRYFAKPTNMAGLDRIVDFLGNLVDAKQEKI